MDLMSKSLLTAVVLSLTLILLRVLRTPLKLALRLLFNTLLGFAALYIIELTAGYTGIALGLNLWNALVVGILGVPGLGLLLLLQWIL